MCQLIKEIRVELDSSGENVHPLIPKPLQFSFHRNVCLQGETFARGRNVSSLSLEKCRQEKGPWGNRNGIGKLRAGPIQIVQIEGSL